MKNKILFTSRLVISALFLLSAIAKLYPTPLYGITKIFEEGQLIPMGFNEALVPYLSRFIIGLEFFIAFAVLQKNYLKRIILPTSISLLVLFSLHLSYQIFLGDKENCGCFGDLIPMTPTEALIKNIITILILLYIYKGVSYYQKSNISNLSIQFLLTYLFVFAFIPIQMSTETKTVSSYSSYVVGDIDINDGEKILCFFDAGCEHCMDAAKSLTKLSSEISDFPKIHIIFSDLEEEKIVDFFKYAGAEYSYQVIPFYNEDDEVNSYLEILGYEYENPAIVYLNNGNQIRFYDGTGANEYKEEELRRLIE
ncbi:MAG: hypothetical protein CMD06_05815 [Flavobacteriales bacterium]|nr:hypothetical protein [Flavobacteriales bacterium]